MSPLRGELTARGLRTDNVLPFLLMWYGWLSKEQGALAKKRRLIVSKEHLSVEASGGVANLTKRGKRMGKIWLAKNVNYDAGYAYATYLQEYGKVSTEPYYIYIGSPLGNAVGLDWYHSKARIQMRDGCKTAIF